ncbi:hypothetical protein E6Q11_06270, partial [Candidatus Dojkabacteria bacterium]
MSNNKPCIWAPGQDANIREPIQALKETGWRYGDVPTASNFNWLFKMLTQEIASLRKDLSTQKDEFNEAISKQAKSYEAKLTGAIDNLETKLTTSMDKLTTKFTRRIDRSSRAAEFNEGISRTLCFLLREMEKTIRHYHSNFPSFPWPLHTDAETMTATEETVGDRP